jgi:hypothetical protein
MTADRVIKWTTAGAVLGVAAIASYEHAYDLVRVHGESGWTARFIPLTVNGLIYASSMWCWIQRAARRLFLPWRGGSLAWVLRRRSRRTSLTA